MIQKIKTLLGLFFFLVVFGWSWGQLSIMRQEYHTESYIPYTVPSAITVPASLEFKGIVSDFLFLKMITSLGEKIGNKEGLGERHADYIYVTTDIITDLDPYFWDPYVFGDMSLAWGFGDINRANELLLKARAKRPEDYRVPYYIGFNYFYFLKDNLNGSRYLMEASRIPGCPSFIPALAARLSIKAQENKAAILFLKEMLSKTSNKQVAGQLNTRLKALIALNYLEIKVKEFHDRFGYYPSKIEDLMDKKIISSLPEDPYGGQFYITDQNRVFTTSELRYNNIQNERQNGK